MSNGPVPRLVLGIAVPLSSRLIGGAGNCRLLGKQGLILAFHSAPMNMQSHALAVLFI
jgi:hypothetical protein